MVILRRTYGKAPLSEKEGNVLFNDALSTFYVRLYSGGTQREMKPAIAISRAALSNKGSFYPSAHIWDSTYHGFWYISVWSTRWKRNSSVGPP